PPLPATQESEQAAANVPVPTNPQLKVPFSEWDLSGIESPLFTSESINEFNERPILLTGRYSVKPHLSISSFYDGNIFVKSTGATSDYITRVEPGLML